MHSIDRNKDTQIVPAIDKPTINPHKIPAICPHTDDFDRIIREITEIEQEIRRKQELPVDPTKQVN